MFAPDAPYLLTHLRVFDSTTKEHSESCTRHGKEVDCNEEKEEVGLETDQPETHEQLLSSMKGLAKFTYEGVHIPRQELVLP